jgi:hypothetical protein
VETAYLFKPFFGHWPGRKRALASELEFRQGCFKRVTHVMTQAWYQSVPTRCTRRRR